MRSQNPSKFSRQVVVDMRLPNMQGDSEPSERHCGEWASALLPVCFGAAMAVASLSVQARPEVAAVVHFVSLGFAVAVAAFLVSKFVAGKFQVFAGVLEGVGVFFMVTAFFVVVSVPLPVSLRVANCGVYVVSCLTVLVCGCL